MTLFEQRADALKPDQWMLVEAHWQTVSTSVKRSDARAAARQHAEALAAAAGRPVDRSLIASGRAAIRRDALLALSCRDELPPAEFDALYAPFERFIPRASL